MPEVDTRRHNVSLSPAVPTPRMALMSCFTVLKASDTIELYWALVMVGWQAAFRLSMPQPLRP